MRPSCCEKNCADRGRGPSRSSVAGQFASQNGRGPGAAPARRSFFPPDWSEDGSPQAIRAILTHEWAHIRNGDLWLLALGRGLLVLLFPHPLLWWLRRAIRGDQELLADAAAAGDNRPAYAEELLRLARKTAYPSPIAASGAVGIWESSSQLSRRIAMLLDESFHVEPRAPRRWRYRALGLLAILGAACSF